MRSRFISGEDIIKELGIRDFELLDYVREGHAPFTQRGENRVGVDMCTVMLKAIIRTEDTLKQLESGKMLIDGTVVDDQSIVQAMREGMPRKLDRLKSLMDSFMDQGWTALTLPTDVDGELTEDMIFMLNGALYDRSEFEAYQARQKTRSEADMVKSILPEIDVFWGSIREEWRSTKDDGHTGLDLARDILRENEKLFRYIKETHLDIDLFGGSLGNRKKMFRERLIARILESRGLKPKNVRALIESASA
jgi:hypothetical protein